jgi:YD repeat-containing protein
MTRRFFTWVRSHFVASAKPAAPKTAKPRRVIPEFERLEKRWLMSWTATGLHRYTDAFTGTFTDFSLAQVASNTGALRLAHPLDFDKSPGTSVGGNPFLLNNSATVSPQPILEMVLASDSGDAVPTQIELQLTWNNGSPQPWITFATTGHAQGDDYLLAAQVSSAVTSTGAYPWSLTVRVTLPSGGGTLDRTAYVVVNDTGPFRGGWSLSGYDQLVSVSGGLLWVYGAGGVRYFASAGGGAFTSPADDFGTLVQNGDNSYTYTEKYQDKVHFDSAGKITKRVDTHNLALSYTYDGGGKLSTIAAPDGGVATFTHGMSSRVQSIVMPGGRTLTLGNPMGDTLTSLTGVDGSVRTFTYDAGKRLTQAEWGPLNAGVVGGKLTVSATYDATTKRLSSVDLGSGSTLGLVPAASQGLTTSPAKNADAAVAVLTDALSQKTTLTLDSAGRTTKLVTPDGATQTWDRDSAGQVTVYKDGLNRATTFTYAYGSDKGDNTRIDYADGSNHQFTYDGTFHHPTRLWSASRKLVQLK